MKRYKKMTDVKRKVNEYLSTILRNRSFKDDDNIFETGAINSLFAMQLVLFLEKEFEIEVNNEELSIDNFLTVEKIAEYVELKLQNGN